MSDILLKDLIHIKKGVLTPKQCDALIHEREYRNNEQTGERCLHAITGVDTHSTFRQVVLSPNSKNFNTVKDAVKHTGATASILFVPPVFAADSAMEAADAGIKTCVAIVDGIPSHDMIKIKRYMKRYSRDEKMRLVGPNCAGIISPGKSMLGIMPGHIYKEGRVGIISRSGTLGYEAAQQLKNLNIGVSTSVGIGGDPINGSSFRDIIEIFETDDETDAILMIGEIGGPQEVAAGEFAKENMKKPVIGYIAGLTAPKGRVMGHAGAIVSAYGESAIEKVEILKECGVTISKNPSVMGDTVKSVLDKI